ncbi:hypothetical protein RHGRI_032600 [Rhododendron griersonianum]|uniref:Uncharacterized protein n=1 Tax=Rhododendron griersonianum TaxID=479676 RepID=A0AAV6IEW3_9ERIC|nr:hypothetical protein RHGRI_032600 [Rhododendron griersonianum]
MEVALAATFPVRRTVEMSFGSRELGCNAGDDDRVLLEVAKLNGCDLSSVMAYEIINELLPPLSFSLILCVVFSCAEVWVCTLAATTWAGGEGTPTPRAPRRNLLSGGVCEN